MRVDPRQAQELLHRCGSGSLGTVSLTMSGYPFVTLLPHVPDAEARRYSCSAIWPNIPAI